MSAVRPQRVDGPAGTLVVDDGGAPGTPLVFLHSLAGNASQWAAQVAHFGSRNRVIAVNLRGHGASDSPANHDFTVEAYAADVLAVLEGLRVDRPVLIGHSMGASVAAEVAGTEPARVRGLVLVDGAFARASPSPEERRWLSDLGTDRYRELIAGHWQAILTGSNADVASQVMADLAATPPDVVVDSFRQLVEHDPIPAIRRFPGPKFLILGDIGNNPMAAHHHVPGLPHAHLGSTGHWLQMDRPHDVNALLEKFLLRVT